jgi:integrase
MLLLFRVGDVDLVAGRITLRDTKNKTDHRILLSRQAMAIATASCAGRAAEEPLFAIADPRKNQSRRRNCGARPWPQGNLC